jgi:hypothetical protein
MERIEFDKTRLAFRKATESGKKLAHTLAMASVRHFAEHGDTSYIADFYSDLRGAGKNFIRSSAFLKWLVAHAPVKLEQNKFVKDQEQATALNWSDQAAREALIAKAEAVSFWDFDPEATITNFKASDVIAAVEKLVKRFENESKSKPEDDAAKAVVLQLKDYVTTLKQAA